MKPGTRITIVLEVREDGGLQVCSDDVPGLILSHNDPAKIMADVWPALVALTAWRSYGDLVA